MNADLLPRATLPLEHRNASLPVLMHAMSSETVLINGLHQVRHQNKVFSGLQRLNKMYFPCTCSLEMFIVERKTKKVENSFNGMSKESSRTCPMSSLDREEPLRPGRESCWGHAAPLCLLASGAPGSQARVLARAPSEHFELGQTRLRRRSPVLTASHLALWRAVLTGHDDNNAENRSGHTDARAGRGRASARGVCRWPRPRPGREPNPGAYGGVKREDSYLSTGRKEQQDQKAVA